MFLTVTRIQCANSVLRLECPLDQLIDVNDFWVGVAKDQMCTPSPTPATVCKATAPGKVVDVRQLCQNKMLCDLSFYSPKPTSGVDSDGEDVALCAILVLSVNYSCISKYYNEINKSLRLLAVLAVCENTDKAMYGTIPNTLYQH